MTPEQWPVRAAAVSKIFPTEQSAAAHVSREDARVSRAFAGKV
jgi:hypothetical protein